MFILVQIIDYRIIYAWENGAAPVLQKVRITAPGGAPGCLAIFVIFSEENGHFNTIWLKFYTFLESFEKTNLRKLELKN